MTENKNPEKRKVPSNENPDSGSTDGSYKQPKTKSKGKKKAKLKTDQDIVHDPMNGGQKQFKKATKAEMRQRINHTVSMICEGRMKHEIKRFFKRHCGVGARQIEEYIRLAREEIAASCPGGDLSVKEIREQHYAVAMSIVSDEDKATKDRIHALKHASSLYGLDAPPKIAETYSNGQDLTLDQRTARLRRAIARLRARNAERNGDS